MFISAIKKTITPEIIEAQTNSKEWLIHRFTRHVVATLNIPAAETIAIANNYACLIHAAMRKGEMKAHWPLTLKMIIRAYAEAGKDKLEHIDVKSSISRSNYTWFYQWYTVTI